jgi:hypothetical protein
MAEDTRETKQSHPAGPPPGATSPPAHITEPKIYEVFHAPPSANALPDGYGQNTAGGRPEPVSLSAAAKTVKLEDFKNIHMIPCARESLLTGIGSAFAVGGTRALLGGMFSSLVMMGREEETLTRRQRRFRKRRIGRLELSVLWAWGHMSIVFKRGG